MGGGGGGRGARGAAWCGGSWPEEEASPACGGGGASRRPSLAGGEEKGKRTAAASLLEVDSVAWIGPRKRNAKPALVGGDALRGPAAAKWAASVGPRRWSHDSTTSTPSVPKYM